MAVLKVCVLLWALVTVVLPGSMDSGPHTPEDFESHYVTKPYPLEDVDAEPDPQEDFDENSDSGSGISKDPRSTAFPGECPRKNAADGNGPLANLFVLCGSAALYLLA
ncbi:hypothetical protein FQA47_020884 [Oryzias melastigma]|uniref:Uncharacterized protein n=1 Tax=Oryzias melastigma TaxID=30732 RepID=A0A834CB61_ORYME|nr:hypothetical protein FQA47_020884 [Oryzias melastigma]